MAPPLTNIDAIREPLVTGLCERLVAEARGVEGLQDLKSPALVNAATETLRALGRERGHDVAPLRRGMGDLGWEQAWGKNFDPDYARLSATDPRELFLLHLVAEVSDLGFQAGAPDERIVEEAALDLAKLIWARVPLKVLVFGAKRSRDAASSLDAMMGGLGSVIGARDREGHYLLVGLPNLGTTGFVPGADWTVVHRVVRQGALEAPVERKVAP